MNISEHLKRNLFFFRFLFCFILVSIVYLAEAGEQADHTLMEEFSKSQEWKNCYREALRVQLEDNTPKAIYYRYLSAIKLNIKEDEALQNLQRLYKSSSSEASLEIKTSAAYEYGMAMWNKRNAPKAFDGLSYAFYNTQNPNLFIQSACSLFLFADDYPEYKKQNPDLYMQINSTRDLWSAKNFNTTRRETAKHKSGIITQAGKGFITFYRTQIGPAIGDRCIMHPSCSEYFRQNINKHGILAVPMQTDRFFREPSEAYKTNNIIEIDGKMKHADPVTDHDFWFK